MSLGVKGLKFQEGIPPYKPLTLPLDCAPQRCSILPLDDV